MTPAKLNTGEPTAVKRDPSDQKITSEGQTGTNTEQASEEYRKRGMTDRKELIKMKKLDTKNKYLEFTFYE